MMDEALSVPDTQIELRERYGRSVTRSQLYDHFGDLGGKRDPDTGKLVFPVTSIPYIARYFDLIEDDRERMAS